jgi:hypothetical protein
MNESEVALTLIQHDIPNFLDEESGGVRLWQTDLSRAFDKAVHYRIEFSVANEYCRRGLHVSSAESEAERELRMVCNT